MEPNLFMTPFPIVFSRKKLFQLNIPKKNVPLYYKVLSTHKTQNSKKTKTKEFTVDQPQAKKINWMES